MRLRDRFSAAVRAFREAPDLQARLDVSEYERSLAEQMLEVRIVGHKHELTMASLFDGIGGFPLAAVRNGIRPVWASEIEPFPIRVTKLHFPGMIHVGDIMKLDGALLPPVDIVCGGSPYQD